MFDQDGDQNKGKTMISQTILLELCVGDRIQLYLYTGTGLSDHKNSRYTHLVGLLLRPSVDSLQDIVMRIGGVDLDDDVNSAADDDTATGGGSIRHV